MSLEAACSSCWKSREVCAEHRLLSKTTGCLAWTQVFPGERVALLEMGRAGSARTQLASNGDLTSAHGAQVSTMWITVVLP